MKAIFFDKIGSPSDDFDVLQMRDIPMPEIRENEVLIKVVSASISPTDFIFMQGLYPEPHVPVFPQIAGSHGAGVITKVGEGVSLKPGTFVGFNYHNCWAEYVAVPVEWLFPLPTDYPIEKATQFFNLISAWDLFHNAKVEPGQWLAQTAGNSTVATLVSQLAKRKGVNVISIVRQAQDHLNLKDLGASEVIELSKLSKPVSERIMEITQNKGVAGVIDCVGGPVTSELIRSLSLGGQVILYGGLSSEKFELHNFDLLFKVAEIKTYAYRYLFTPPEEEDITLLQEIAEVSSEFYSPVGGVHALEDFKTAIYESLHHPERGKRFFKISSLED
ncbi:quinone oxidoreductase family protein [Paenibacillus beijingensis]|uniref:Enoyl reductase (ER) domain-containing protein n=1 Tax=Paenibacillus beijingensis TaxID=1126833 RepID=A0A0D5NG84_9BACL|nr:zinc-binding dehydrogenase [Paenibacillus beijingensis]AJY74120.1 hypothetical protein VN24_05305 [Paenibacillus beijingensis]